MVRLFLPNQNHADVVPVSSASMALADLEAVSAAAGAKVAQLKKDKAEKDVIDAAVAELLKAKGELKAALEEAVKAAEASGASNLSELQEKLAAATPKPSGKDKKKGGGEKGGKEDAEKAANIKAAEEAKAAARAKKKAEAAAGGKDKGTKPAQKEGAAATPGPPAAAAGGAPAAAAPPTATAPTTAAKPMAQNKGIELHCTKDAVPLLALTVARLAKLEVQLKRVDAKQLPNGGDPVLYLPLGKGTLAGAEVVARYLARAAQPQPSLLYGTPTLAL